MFFKFRWKINGNHVHLQQEMNCGQEERSARPFEAYLIHSPFGWRYGLITYHAMADDHIPINMYFRERKQSICSSATSKRKWSCFQQRLTAALGLVPQRPTLLMAYPMINCREITLICNVVLPHGMNPPDAFSLERSLPAIPAVKKEIHDIGRNVTCLECPANTWLYPFADARLYLGEGSCRSSLQARQPV